MSNLDLGLPSESWQLNGSSVSPVIRRLRVRSPSWGSEIVFLRLELDKRLSVIQDFDLYFQFFF